MVDLRIPFFRLVFFPIKVALVAIAAAIILSIITFVLSTCSGRSWAVLRT